MMAESSSPSKPKSPQRSRWKSVLFRLVAVLIGLSPLVACELALRAFDLGRPTDYNDPFVGFSDIHPLFVLNEQTQKYEIPVSRQTHFCPESFAAHKPANEFRIFVLGGSTVQGRPYAIETSFTTWLELNLAPAEPKKRWEVVNCGGVSYASYRLVPILQEVLAYQPDLVIFCEGHNEFLEDRSYGDIKSAPALLAWPQRMIARLRTYTLFRDAVLRLRGTSAPQSLAKRAVLGPETDAMLDWKGGIAKYHRDPEWQKDVAAHFEFNLRRMVAIAGDAKVPLLFISPVSNLDWPPFKPEHQTGITEKERQEFARLLAEASKLYATNLPAALDVLHAAARIDDQHALVHYEIGMCNELLGRMPEAKAALIKAKDLDVCPLRMLEPLKGIIAQVADETGTPLLDAEALIAEHSRCGFPNNQWLIDHVHPTIEGHQLIAEAIALKMAQLGYVRLGSGWQPARDEACEKHLASLGHVYFERGKQRLQSEQGWAHGKVNREKAAAAAVERGNP